METVLRVGFVYIFLLVVLRVMGKRELSQLTPLELVMLLLIPELVAQALVREDFSMTNAVIAVTTLTSLVFITSVLSYRFKRLEALLDGAPSVLVDRGALVPDEMALERVSASEISAEMRRSGIERFDEVKWVVLEPGGKLSIIRYDGDSAGPPPEEDEVT